MATVGATALAHRPRPHARPARRLLRLRASAGSADRAPRAAHAMRAHRGPATGRRQLCLDVLPLGEHSNKVLVRKNPYAICKPSAIAPDREHTSLCVLLERAPD